MPKSLVSLSKGPKTPYDRTKSTSLATGPSSSSPTKIPPKPYHLSFGKHKGQTLQDVHAIDPGYITNFLLQGDIIKYYSLDTTLAQFHEIVKPFPVQPDPEWKALSLTSAPKGFDNEKWISKLGARSIFGLPEYYFVTLELAGANKVWLYHVWDCLKWFRGKKEADLRLAQFSQKNEGVVRDSYDRMGLGITDGMDMQDSDEEEDREEENDGEKVLDCQEGELADELWDEYDMLRHFDPPDEVVEQWIKDRSHSLDLADIECFDGEEPF